tara:strand:- start:321 stop:764 length:444 start_codon:yes stop_codon:yes gene_type:complete
MSSINLQTYDKYIIKIPINLIVHSNLLSQIYENENYDNELKLDHKYCTKDNINWIFQKYFKNTTNFRKEILSDLKSSKLKKILHASDFLDIHELYQNILTILTKKIESCKNIQDLETILGVKNTYKNEEKDKLKIVLDHNKKTQYMS